MLAPVLVHLPLPPSKKYVSKQAITNNGGINFKSYAASPILQTDSRYAVYPSEKEWYIAGGEFPTAPPAPPPAGSAARPRRFRKSSFQTVRPRWLLLDVPAGCYWIKHGANGLPGFDRRYISALE